MKKNAEEWSDKLTFANKKFEKEICKKRLNN